MRSARTGSLTLVAAATVFAVGFVIMTPIGPVSTICIRRILIAGPPAGIAAGAGTAVGITAYAELGVTSSTFVAHAFAPYTKLWHVTVALALIAIAVLIARSRPRLPDAATPSGASIASGFGAALALTLANPADILLFAAVFAGLGITVHSLQAHLIFGIAIFTGGCAYWTALALLLARWRTALTSTHIGWLNLASAAMMVVAALISLISLARATN